MQNVRLACACALALPFALSPLIRLAAAADPAPDATITVAGAAETVFDHARDACETLDIPDAPARAIRVGSGAVELIASHYVTYRMVGKDLDHLKNDCSAPAMRSDLDSDPSHFADYEWPASFYTLDGKTIYAIIHDEYHPWQHKERPLGDLRSCGPTGNDAMDNCGYNALGLAVSHDSGKTFDHPPAPRQLVATMPDRYQPGAGKTGVFAPSNIVRNPADGFYYLFAYAELGNKPSARHACLLRTDDLANPASWRAWDGSGFSVAFHDPYAESSTGQAQPICAPIRGGAFMVRNLTFNSALNAWLAIEDGPRHADGNPVAGFYYSVSPDLLTWSKPKPVTGIALDLGAQTSYPSLIDPTDTSRNFERSGAHAYLYYTLWDHSAGPAARNLVRVPLTIAKE